jgi:hypothetical protein
LRFDKPGGPGQFHGLSRLALNNNLQDPSQVHQVFAYQVFRAAGVPAPRCNLARVFVNGRDLGIYSHVEAIQEEFLRRIFGEDSGNLYEGQISDFRPQWIKTFERKNPDALRGRRDLDAVVEALQSPADTLLARVGAKVDVEAYLTFWAVECVLGHWDSYSNNGNNFFVYHRAATDRFQFIPWGADSVLGDPDPFSRHKKPAIVTASMILPQRLYQLPAVRQQYFDRVRQVLREAWDEDHLLAETRRWESLVRPHLQVKTNHFEEALAKVRRFIKDRRGVLKGELEGPTPAWTWPLKKNGCLEKSGWVEAAFNTTWEGKPASNEVVQSSASLTVVRDGDQRRFWLAGVTAGPARDPRNEGSPAIAVIGLQVLRGRAVVPVVIIEPELFRPRARLPIDCFGVAGVLLESQLAAFNLKTPALLLGTLELDEAGQKPGARIKGRFQADIYGLLE